MLTQPNLQIKWIQCLSIYYIRKATVWRETLPKIKNDIAKYISLKEWLLHSYMIYSEFQLQYEQEHEF